MVTPKTTFVLFGKRNYIHCCMWQSTNPIQWLRWQYRKPNKGTDGEILLSSFLDLSILSNIFPQKNLANGMLKSGCIVCLWLCSCILVTDHQLNWLIISHLTLYTRILHHILLPGTAYNSLTTSKQIATVVQT
jgi:hypothetical protein